MRDSRILCPICKKMYKDKIGHHLVSVHNIKNPDAETIKNGLIHIFYFPDDLDNEKNTLDMLAKHGFKFEKLTPDVAVMKLPDKK